MVALNRQLSGIVPRNVVIQAGVTLAYAAKTWQVKDVGAYNLAVLEPFELGYKLGVTGLLERQVSGLSGKEESEGPPYHMWQSRPRP